MKLSTTLSLVAFAFATTTFAIPTPDAPDAPAVNDDANDGTLEARSPVMWGKKKLYPGTDGYKRDVDEPEGETLEKRVLWGKKKLYPGIDGYKRDVDEPEEETLEKRVLWGKKKLYPGNEGYRKRDAEKPDGFAAGHGTGNHGSHETPHSNGPPANHGQGESHDQGQNNDGKPFSRPDQKD